MEKGLAVASIAIIIGLTALGFGWNEYTTLSDQVTSISEELRSESMELRNSINSLQEIITSLQDSLAQNRQADNASAQHIAELQVALAQNEDVDDDLAQQIDELQTSLQTLQNKLSGVSSQLNSTEASNSASFQQISSELQNISGTIETLSDKVNALYPQIPQSTLVIVESSYDNTTNIFTFVVQNTQDTLVYAQLYANFYSLNNGHMGQYYSQMYSFNPGQNTTTTLNLHDPIYYYFGANAYISSLAMKFIAAPDIEVSPTYTFNVVPYWIIQ